MGEIFFAALYQPLYNLLVAVYDILPAWGGLGLAIIIVTILVKLFVLPMTYKSIKAQKEMQEIQPKIAEIKERLKDDKEALAKELMNVYKMHNVNPFASCLPAIVQMFVFIALYQVLSAGLGDVNAETLYSFVHNPGTMSAFFLGIDLRVVSPLLGIVAGATQYVQAKQMVTQRPPKAAREGVASLDEDMTAAMNKSMLYALPIMMLVLGATTLPAGLTLYIIMSTVLTYMMYAVFLGKPSNKASLEVIQK
jgi:YidC/Oxa1 family membrane protein insertase